MISKPCWDAQGRAAAGAALSGLTSEQRMELARLARRAWDKLENQGTPFDDWRHRQCLQAVERGGVRECRQEDYLPLKAHFLRLLGIEGEARRLEKRAAHEPHRVAMAKLRLEMAAVMDVIGQPAQYVASIARCKYKTTNLDELSERQLWTLVFDIRRAAQKRRAGTRIGAKKHGI